MNYVLKLLLRRGVLLAALALVVGAGTGRAAGIDSTELVRQRVRMEDHRLRGMLGQLFDQDFAYREIVIRRLTNDVGADLKQGLFEALKTFMVERGVASQVDVERISFVDSVRLYAAVSGDSVDIFWLHFYSERDSTFSKAEFEKRSGETVQRQITVQLIREFQLIGRQCYEALDQTFVGGEYKGVSVREVLDREFLSPLNSDLVDVYGGFGGYGDKIVLDPAQRLQYYNLFGGFYSVRPVMDTVNARDTVVDDTVKGANPPRIVQKTVTAYDAIVPSKQVKPVFGEPLLDFSLLHQLTLNPFDDKSFGFEARLGNDEVGLPFWSSGTGRAFLILRNKIFEESVFKLGVAFPFGVGETSTSSLFRPRTLASGWGFAMDATIPSFNVPAGLNLPIGFSVQYIPSFKKNSTVINAARGATIYYPSFIGTFYFPFVVDLNPRRHTAFVKLEVGLGWEDVERAVAVYPGYYNPQYAPDTIKAGDARIDDVTNLQVASTRATPHVRVDYVNHEAAKFGAFAQFDHLWMVGGWIELFDGFRIEGEYAAPLRPADPWEPSSFFLISPRIRIM